ncbi:hypothetical protein BDZ89DRAFT_1214613, partial [Hymenopellis radicata]
VGSYSLNVAEVASAMMHIAVLFLWELCITTDTLENRLSAGYMFNRAGTFAVSQFPLIAVLGTKNSILATWMYVFRFSLFSRLD